MARKKEIGVYSVTNLKNGKRYVGSSIDLKGRKDVHFSNLRRGISSHKYLKEDYDKYGERSFIFEILEYCEKEIRFEREQYWMNYYKSCDREFGYNISVTAGKVTHTEEMKKNMSERLKGNTYTLGFKQSEETKKRISEALMGNTHGLGIKPSEETRQKHRERMMGNTHSNGKNIGRVHSEETRRKVSLSKIGSKHSEESKKKMSELAKLRWEKKRLEDCK